MFNLLQMQNLAAQVELEPQFETAVCAQNFESNGSEGFWLPELNPFFPTMLAKPHIIGYSAGYRTYDKVFKISCLPVSIGDQFCLYQLKSSDGKRLSIGIEACVWAIFEGRAQTLSLINADYYVALPLTFIKGPFSARLRLYHESSHLGDEFLLENQSIKRLNPSMEVVDFSLAYEFKEQLTVFVGFSKIIRCDDSFNLLRESVYYGLNYYLDAYKINVCNLEASPYLAFYFTNRKDRNWKVESTAAIGYEWYKNYGHKFRLCLEGHDGYSNEGQFARQRTRYFEIKMIYGY